MRRPVGLVPVVVPVLSVLSAAALLGCSAHQPSSVRGHHAAAPSGSAVATAAPTSRHEAATADDAAVARVREELDSTYERGLAAWMAGDVDRAFDLFDEALEPVLDAPFDPQAHPELAARIEEVVAAVHELTVEAGEPEIDAGTDLELAALTPVPAHAAERPVPRPAALDPDSVHGAQIYTGPYTIPMADDPAIDSMVSFYTGRVKDRFEVGLARYGRFAPTVRRILKEEGVPPDLCWLALVESNYNPTATSHARAHGLWQFIPSTGKRYGLEQDFWVDERADFEKATRSAARYLRFLHDEFGDWHLALAAYNAGEGRVGRAIRATGRRDYWHIRKTRHIRSETKTYVPAFLAVLRIVRDPAAYGINIEPLEPYEWDTLHVDDAVDLEVVAELAGCSADEVRELNPELKRQCTPAGRRHALRVPRTDQSAHLETKLASLPPEKRLRWRRHVVRRGETLTGIARLHGSSVSAMLAANEIRNPHRISIGASLLVPTGAGAAQLASSGARTASASTRSQPTKRSYQVRPGDTLGVIAQRYGTSVRQVASWNGLGNANRIRVGQRLTIYSDAEPRATNHVVQRGDTLYEIARRYGCSVSDLQAWNGLPSSGLIRPGQTLKVNGRSVQTRTHTVRPGDTLFEIARAYRTTVSNLRAWNDLNRRRYIHPGERLTIFSD